MKSAEMISLQQMLAEMKTALDAEIKAQENSNKGKHIAVDGISLGEQSGLYLYKFSFKDPWEVDDDTPVKVQIRSNQIIKAYIVKSTGIAVTIATDKQLPRDELQQITLFDDSTGLLKRLKEVLQSSDESYLHLGSKAFGLEVSKRGKVSSSIPSSVFQPDASQQKAIQTALGSEVTYIIGPPGTGKTVTLATIALDHLLAGRTILITAHTNIAVDNAIKTLTDHCEKAGTKSYLQKGEVIRFGAIDKQSVLSKPEYEYVYLPAIIKRRSAERQNEKEILGARRKELEMQLLPLTEVNERKRNQWRTQRQQLVTQNKTHHNDLTALQNAEKQRTTALNAEKMQLEEQQKQVRQELSTINQKLAWQVRRSAYLENEKGQLLVQQNNISGQLTAAQQMNKITLILKRIHPDKLAQDLVSVNQRIWEVDNEERRLKVEKDDGYSQNSYLQKQDQTLTGLIDSTLSQVKPPSDTMQIIGNLQAVASRIELQIKNGDNQFQAEERTEQVQISDFKKQIAGIEQRLDEVQKELNEIEKSIVADARVVATTLSKTFMSSIMRERPFDVVIIDEASMAPLPAVYIAASRAVNSVVIVGDPQQLAPISKAKDNKKLSATEQLLASSWLGTDLFVKNGITLENAQREYKNSIILTHQSRMHQEISSIAIKFIYEGILQDELSRTPKEQLSQVEPATGKHLVLCDTSDASPVAIRPEYGSRYNVYHALCSLAIARRVLSSLPEDNSGQKERIGIVTPYARQAKLLQNLIKDAGIDKLVRAGTVHRFQGLEFDVVIFDTVESPNIPPFIYFIAGGKGTDALRLINVAVTRAKHKLIIVANAQHILNSQDNQRGLWFPNESILRKTVEQAGKIASIRSLQVLDLPLEDIKGTLMPLKSLPESQLTTLPAKWRAITEKAPLPPTPVGSTHGHGQEKAKGGPEKRPESGTRAGQLLGNYRIINKLGSGGFAEVWLAEDINLATQVALKILSGQLTQNGIEDFLKEARTIARLKHPHIVRVLYFGADDLFPYLVMDYAPKGTLRQQHPKGCVVPPAMVLSYVKQVASALQYAHDAKIIHRDVKPENMLLDSHNEISLSDFGIAIEAHSTLSMEMQDNIGTSPYMAPEQIQGKSRPASDQYALGIVVYEWLCGSCPFTGSNAEIRSQHIYASPRPLHEIIPTVSPAVEQVVLKALSKDPLQRFDSMQAFATALEKAH